MRGRAASGLSCILVRVLTKATLPDSPAGLRQSTLLFLGAAAALLAACTAAASWLPKEAPGVLECSAHVCGALCIRRLTGCLRRRQVLLNAVRICVLCGAVCLRMQRTCVCVYCMMHWLAS